MEIGVVDFQSPVEGAGCGNPSEDGVVAETDRNRYKTLICDLKKSYEYWIFIDLPQIPQMLYYLNLKIKKYIRKYY